MPIFAVIRTRGSAWQESQALEGQPEWTAHAAYMNALAKNRFVLLGGPLEGRHGGGDPLSSRGGSLVAPGSPPHRPDHPVDAPAGIPGLSLAIQ
jgi:hypothetical protein